MAQGFLIGAGGGGGGVARIRSIEVTTAPTKTSYTAGETLDLTGIVVKANWSSGLQVDITSECTFSPTAGTTLYEDTTAVSISYTNNGTTYTTTQAITVQRVLTGLRVDTEPTTSYVAGQALNLSGAVVSAVFSSGRSVVVAATPSIADGTIIYEDTSSLTWSYTENSVTQTATTALTVQRVLQSIAITTQPTTTTYKSGDSIDTTGMVVTATYHRTTDTVSGYTVSPSTAGSTEGTQTETVSYTENSITKTAVFYVTIKNMSIYGVQWDGSSTTLLSRTDAAANFTNPVPYVAGATNYGSPFDDLMPWSGIERVSNSAAGELVKIPKFWYKTTFSGSTFKLQIADGEADGFSVAPAFMDRGDGKGERDFAYVGRYHCSSSNYKSATGVTPKVNITRDAARTGIKALGSGIWQWDYAMLITIQMLYLVEYANWNVQATIGGGCSQTSASSSAVFNCGGTDSMPYHTGTVSANHADYGDCQYRYIENLWGNCYDWCDGIYFSAANVYAIKNPANFSDTANGTLVAQRTTSSGYISALAKSSASGFDWFYYPSAVAGADGTYIPDYCGYSASGVVLRVGGSYNQNPDRGLFCLSGYNAASNSGAYIGSRLQYLP
ncbi:MAG: bacterial Ig-like domain-containing protein [Firmicutes bacterium]|nr:bacterial Ig-like domain-containing protein [Bacillota bacterium]